MKNGERGRRLLRALDIDQTVLFGIGTRVWTVLGGPVTILLLVAFFSSELQGFYFTFTSIVALQNLLELGFRTVAMHFASHEWAHLHRDEDGLPQGDPDALSRLRCLYRVTLGWFATVGGLVAICLAIGGYVFFSNTAGDTDIAWQAPWLALSLFVGIQFALTPTLALLQGCGEVKQVYRFQAVEAFLTRPALWGTIALGGELWACVALAGTQVALVLFFLLRRYGGFFRSMLQKPEAAKMEWIREVVPMQWRMALATGCDIAVFPVFNMTIFASEGAAAAGRLGMTINLIAAVTSITGTWVIARTPEFGVYVAKKAYRTLHQRLTRIFAVTFPIHAFLLGVLFIGIVIYPELNTEEADVVLVPSQAILFLIAAFLLRCSLPFSVYMRAHKEEPLMIVSLIFTGGLLLYTVTLGRTHGVTGIGVAYMSACLLRIPASFIIYKRASKRYRAASSAQAQGHD